MRQASSQQKYVFNRLKSRFVEDIKEDKRSIGRVAGLDIVSLLFKKQIRVSWEKIVISGLLSHHLKQNGQKDTQMQVELGLRIISSVSKTIHYKRLAQCVNKWKRGTLAPPKRTTVECDSLTKVKGVLVKALASKMEKKFQRLALSQMKSTEETDRKTEALTQSIRFMKYKNLCYGIKNICQRVVKSSFDNIRQSKLRNETEFKLGRDFYSDLSMTNNGMKGFFVKCYDLLRKIHYDASYINIAFVDVINEKVVCYSKQAVQELTIITPSKKQMKNIEKVMETEMLKLVDSRSVLDADRDKCPYITYHSIELNQKSVGYCEDPRLLIEITTKQNPKSSFSNESKCLIKASFAGILQKVTANLKLLSMLNRKYTSKACSFAFLQWLKRTSNQRNAVIINETSSHFQDVEQQMIGLETSIKDYQTELQQYEVQIKNLNEELKTKNENVANLQLKMEQVTLERKAKTKCLSASLLHSTVNFLRTRKNAVKQGFLVWKNITNSSHQAVYSTMAQINHKHNQARFQAASTILQHIHSKNFKNNVTHAFKSLAFNSISIATLIHKSPFSEKDFSKSVGPGDSEHSHSKSKKQQALTPPAPASKIYGSGHPALQNAQNNGTSSLTQSYQFSSNPPSIQFQPTITSTPNQTRNNSMNCSNSSFKKSLPLPISSMDRHHHLIPHPSREGSPAKSYNLPPTSQAKMSVSLNLHKENKYQNPHEASHHPTQSILSASTFGIHDSQRTTNERSNYHSNNSSVQENVNKENIAYNGTSGITQLNLNNFPSYLPSRGSVQNSAKSYESSENPFGKYAKLYREGDHQSSVSSLASSAVLNSNQLHMQSQQQPQNKSPNRMSFVQYKDNKVVGQRTDEKPPSAGKISEKTRKFLEDMDLNRFNTGKRSQRTNRNEDTLLNKSDNAIMMKGDHDESFDALNYSANMGHGNATGTNNSNSNSVNLNRRMLIQK
jgi:hypothetical protein